MRALGAGWTEADQARCLGGPIERVMEYMVDKPGAGTTRPRSRSWSSRGWSGCCAPSRSTGPTGPRAFSLRSRRGGGARALVSASYRRLVDAVLDKVGTGRFATTVAGDEVARTKPDPEPVPAGRRAARRRPAPVHRRRGLADGRRLRGGRGVRRGGGAPPGRDRRGTPGADRGLAARHHRGGPAPLGRPALTTSPDDQPCAPRRPARRQGAWGASAARSASASSRVASAADGATPAALTNPWMRPGCTRSSVRTPAAASRPA